MIPDFEQHEVWPVNEEDPYRVLPSGVYPADLNNLKERFVTAFPESISRKRILKNFSKLLHETVRFDISMVHWVDGSYLTSKTNPNDIDMVTFARAEDLNALSHDGRYFFDRCINGKNETKRLYDTHSFLCVLHPPDHPRHALSENTRRYFRKWFGHTRRLKDPHREEGELLPEHPKGMVSLVTGDAAATPSVSTEEEV